MRTRIQRARLLCACAVVLPCLLAACGSGAGRTTVTRTVTHTATAHALATHATGTSTPTTTSTPPQPAAVQCVAAELALSFTGSGAATGHEELSFTLRNASSHSCRTGGYPGVLFLGASGHPLPTAPDHTTSDFFGHTTLRELSVAPGATVSFRLGTTDVSSGGTSAGCVRALALQVIAPNDTATMRVGLRAGIVECQGKVTVSPVQAGATP